VLWLPLLVSLLIAAVTAPRVLAELKRRALTRENYRGVAVPIPGGITIAIAAIIALVPLTLLFNSTELEVYIGGEGIIIYVFGMALLGLIDDLMGSAPVASGDGGLPRGWRGHGRAILRGEFSSGALKAAGALGLALFILSGPRLGGIELAIATLLLVTTTNLFNLLDLRPGRSIKVLILLGAGLLIASRELEPLWALGLFLGPILVFLPFDLRERGMLGDTGSNVVGAVAGLWMVMTLPTAGQAIALAIVLGITIYGEFRSISALVEKTPGLRGLDSLGRAHA